MLVSKTSDSIVGTLNDRYYTILSSLLAETDVHLQMTISVAVGEMANHDSKTTKSQLACLSVIIYSTLDLFGEIGEYLDNNDLFLQDPYSCERNVKYRNPHRLSGLDDSVPKTFDMARFPMSCETISNSVDLLREFESSQDVSEAETPKTLRTSLYK